MKFILLTLSILLAGALLQPLLPWWSIIIIAGLLSLLFNLSTGQRVGAAFLAVFLLWGGYAAFLDYQNTGILSERIGVLLGGVSGMALVALTGILGGLFGALGALTGSWGKEVLN